MNRGQSSIEFILLIAFMSIVLLSFISITQSRTREIEKQNTLQELGEVANLIQTEIQYAERLGEGYRRTFTLPHSIRAMKYTMELRNNEDLVLQVGQLQHVVFLETPISGQLHPGDNTLAVLNGKFVLNLDELNNRIVIDGLEEDWISAKVVSAHPGQAWEYDDLWEINCDPNNCDSTNSAAGKNDAELRDFYITNDHENISFKIEYAVLQGQRAANPFTDLTGTSVNTIILLDTDNNPLTGYSASLSDKLPAPSLGADYFILDAAGIIPNVAGVGSTEWVVNRYGAGVYKYAEDSSRNNNMRQLKVNAVHDFVYAAPQASPGSPYLSYNIPSNYQTVFNVGGVVPVISCMYPKNFSSHVYERYVISEFKFVMWQPQPLEVDTQFYLLYKDNASATNPKLNAKIPINIQCTEPTTIMADVTCQITPPAVIDDVFFFCIHTDWINNAVPPSGPHTFFGGNTVGTSITIRTHAGVWGGSSQMLSFKLTNDRPTVSIAAGLKEAVGGSTHFVELSVPLKTLGIDQGDSIRVSLLGVNNHDTLTYQLDAIPPPAIVTADPDLTPITYHVR